MAKDAERPATPRPAAMSGTALRSSCPLSRRLTVWSTGDTASAAGVEVWSRGAAGR